MYNVPSVTNTIYLRLRRAAFKYPSSLLLLPDPTLLGTVFAHDCALQNIQLAKCYQTRFPLSLNEENSYE